MFYTALKNLFKIISNLILYAILLHMIINVKDITLLEGVTVPLIGLAIIMNINDL